MTAPQRFQEIDVFRGIAALWVVLFHFVLRYQEMGMAPGPAPDFAVAAARAVGGVFAHFGLLPVFWFFAISGFVIVWTLERCRTWRDFAVSRVARLYPVYWVALTLTFLAGGLWPLPGQAYSAKQFLWNLTMFQEFAKVDHIDGVYWSLTVELLFYFGMATIFATGLMGRLRAICLLWAAACVANHALASMGIDVFWIVQKYGLLRQGHFLIAGIMFYEIWRGRPPVLPHAILGLCLVSIGLAYPVADAAMCAVFFAAFWLAIKGHLRAIAVRPLLWLGSISYALYVCHQMLGYRLMRSLESLGVPRLGAILLALVFVLGLAAALTRWVDRPVRPAIRASLRRWADRGLSAR